MRRARPRYVFYAAALILGLVGGLWAGSRVASVSSSNTFRAPPTAETVAFARTASEVRVDNPAGGGVDSATGGVEDPARAAAPVIDDGRMARPAPPADEARGPKEPGAETSAAADGTHGGKAAIESVGSAAGVTKQQPGGGPCRLLVSEHSLSIHAGGGSDTITVSSQSADGPAHVTATTKNWPDIVVLPESRGKPGGPVRYSVVSVSKRTGVYAVHFKSPCGTKTVPVTVQQQ
jgi:hypothetical protein